MADNVVLVHGLWLTRLEMVLLARRLRRCGFKTWLFPYRSVRTPLDQCVRQLQRFVERIPGDTVHFVGHSLGGVVIRRLFADYPAQRPGNIVALGSPFRGSCAAQVLHDWRLGRFVLGKSAETLNSGQLPWREKRPFGVIAGEWSLGGGRLLRAVAGPNDGTVAVEETQLPGITAHIVLPVTHTGLILSRAVARQVCTFLRQGRFEGALETPA